MVLPENATTRPEESIIGNGVWQDPTYNDQHTIPVNNTSSLFAYSGELFNDDVSDDEDRDTNADGHIKLTEVRNNRTLVILNTFEIPQDTQCSDQTDNDGDTNIDIDDAACHTDGDPNNPDSTDGFGQEYWDGTDAGVNKKPMSLPIRKD